MQHLAAAFSGEKMWEKVSVKMLQKIQHFFFFFFKTLCVCEPTLSLPHLLKFIFYLAGSKKPAAWPWLILAVLPWCLLIVNALQVENPMKNMLHFFVWCNCTVNHILFVPHHLFWNPLFPLCFFQWFLTTEMWTLSAGWQLVKNNARMVLSNGI